jgi:hypothetical protein
MYLFPFFRFSAFPCDSSEFGWLFCVMHHYLFQSELWNVCVVARPGKARKRRNQSLGKTNKQCDRVNFSFNLYKNVLMMGRDWNGKLAGGTTCALTHISKCPKMESDIESYFMGLIRRSVCLSVSRGLRAQREKFESASRVGEQPA